MVRAFRESKMNDSTSRSRIGLGPPLVAVLFLIAGSGLAAAQSLTGSIVGKVIDPSRLALPGVTVTITSPQLLGESEVAVTTPSGQYRFPRVTAGTYRVSFEISGFQTLNREGIVVRAGTVVTIDVQLPIAGVEETLTVTGESPLLDVKGSQILESYSQDLIQNIPTSRTYVDIYHQLPGVEDGQYRELTPGASSINGGTNRDNRVNLEGANLNDALVVNVASDISYEIVEEVQVVTSGINAEFGGVTAGVVNVITKSGGNDFSGAAYYYYSDEGLQGNNVTEEFEALGVGSGTALLKDWNGGFSFGGPIVKDRLWFFGNYDYKAQDSTIINFDPTIVARQSLYFIKGTGQIAENHKVSALYQYRDKNDFPFIPQSRQKVCPEGVACSDFGVLRTQDHNNNIFFGSWTGVFSDNFIFDVRGNISNQSRFQDFPNANAGEVGYEDRGTRDRFGPWYRAVVHPGSRNTRELKGDASYFATDFLGGTHDIKFGAVYDLLYTDELREWKNGARIHFLFNGEPDRIRLGNNPVTLRANVGSTALYLQDQWTASDRLTLSLGLRFENHDVWIPEGFTGGENFDRVTFPREDLANMSTWSPRLGFSYDIVGDRKTVLKATFGRLYAQVYGTPFNRVAKFAQGDRTFDWNDLNGDFIYQPGEEGDLVRDTTRKDLAGVDPNLKVPYWHTFTVSVERELLPDFRISVAGLWRKGYDDIEAVDASRPFDEAYNPVTLENPLTGDPITIYALKPEFRRVPSETLITNPNASYCSFCEDIVQEYKGLQITLEKRLRDRWQLYGSYTFSAAEGNKGTHHRTSQASVYSNPNNLVNAFGKTTLNRNHSFKFAGSYLGPYDIWLSASYFAQTGIPLQRDRGVLGPLVRYGRAAHPDIVVESRIDVRGLPPGDENLDARHLLDFRAEKRISLGGERFLGVIADIRNLLNDSSVNFMDDVRVGSSGFGVPGSLVFARTLRLGIRLQF